MKNLIIKTLLIFFILAIESHALIKIDITRGNLDPLPVAVSLYMLIPKLKKLKTLM